MPCVEIRTRHLLYMDLEMSRYGNPLAPQCGLVHGSSSFETLADMYRNTQCHIPDNNGLIFLK